MSRTKPKVETRERDSSLDACLDHLFPRIYIKQYLSVVYAPHRVLRLYKRGIIKPKPVRLSTAHNCHAYIRSEPAIDRK